MKQITKNNDYQRAQHYARDYCVTYWLAAIEALFLFALVDAGVIAWSAGFVSGEQLTATWTTYLLIASGLLFTSYKLAGARKQMV